jgi:hypothetical protein
LAALVGRCRKPCVAEPRFDLGVVGMAIGAIGATG